MQLSSQAAGGSAYAVSLDGGTIVGCANGAFRYTYSGGYSVLSLGSITDACALAVSGDGSDTGDYDY